MKIYLVGGYVRDVLLGKKPKDKDYVVVGATPELMLSKGFISVGKDFPVFLHPKTKEEYALARKEIKVGVGHKAFSFISDPTVTLEEDLFRRDLTINAIAMDPENNNDLIDPFNGQEDLKNKLLKHVSNHFAEDPLRVLRVARFNTRFYDFTIAKETLELMTSISKSGELLELSGERIFMEFKKALLEDNPEIFFTVLDQCQALSILFPEIKQLQNIPQTAIYHPEGDAYIHTMLVLKRVARLTPDFNIRFSCLTHDLGKALTPSDTLPSHRGHENRGMEPITNLCERLKVPNKSKDLALRVCAYHLLCHRSFELKPSTILKLFTNINAFRDKNALEDFLICCEADSLGKLEKEYPQKTYLLHLFNELQKLDISPLTEKYQGEKLGQMINEAKIKKIKELIKAK